MFNPDMMSAMSEMMKNPNMMQQMENMMKNPDFMNNAMKMMNNPDMNNPDMNNPDMNNPDMNNLNQTNNDDANINEIELDDSNINEIELDDSNNCCYENKCKTNNKYSKGDRLKLVNLKADSYNGKECEVKTYDSIKNRYNVYINPLDKIISIKESNLEIIDEIAIEVD